MKTQELYALVFVTRYLDLFTDFISVYNTLMKLIFIASSLAIVWCMRMHRLVKRSYDKELDTFRHYLLVVGSAVLALIVHEKFTFQEVNSVLAYHCGIFILLLNKGMFLKETLSNLHLRLVFSFPLRYLIDIH